MKKRFRFLLLIVFCFSVNNLPAQHRKKAKHNIDTTDFAENKTIVKYGIASFYSKKFHGRQTANGEIYRNEKYSAACNILPLNTWIKVTNLRNNKSIIVKTNDRMNHKNKRLMDLSRAAAEKLGYISRGLTKVKVEVLKNYKPEEEN